MADKFKFEKNDSIVKKYLSKDQIDAVTEWQTTETFDFELHVGHITGLPIYIRPEGNIDQAKLPKFDTKNKSASNYAQISNFANSEKLEGSPLKAAGRAQLLSLVKNNWDCFSTIPKKFY
jgi:hypothetical protein